MFEPTQTQTPERGGRVAPQGSTGTADGAHAVLRPAGSCSGSDARAPRRFEFQRDSFAFANELHWEYRFDAATGKMTFSKREPKPDYAHRCFVLTRAARQFLYHARFDPDQADAGEETCRRLIREVMSRNPRAPCSREREVVFPGYESLWQFSRSREMLLKAECGGAWQSYVLRSHWRMILPISRAHQVKTAKKLSAEIRRSGSTIVHLVRFPSLTINHGMVLFDAAETPTGVCFQAYDPNDPAKPTQLLFERAERTFLLPANRYWAGGRVDVIQIYRGWFM